MTIGWGILGTGGISAAFAAGLAHVPGARITAVASRDAERAERFRAQLGAERAHVEVEALAADPRVEVVYVGTPHVRHAADALAVIAHGKAVLVEKPFCVTAGDARRVLAAARARGVLAMEAMWTRFFPAMDALIDELRAGAIGPVELLHADFGFRGDRVAEPRLFDPAFAGGAILDVGVYPIWLALELCGPARAVQVSAAVGPTGVEERAGLTLSHAGGAISVMSCAISTETPSAAAIFGARGSAELSAPWWRPAGYRLHGREAVARPYLGNGYAHEAIEVNKLLEAGALESPRMTHARSLEILEVTDRARARVGAPEPSA